MTTAHQASSLIPIPDRAIPVGSWARDEDFGIHPVGSKPKRTLVCPEGIGNPSLIPGHLYLFKQAAGWKAPQLWSEVIAYRLGRLIGLNVPPCFAAYDERTNEAGALIEFFLNYPNDQAPARLLHGADVMRRKRSEGTDRPHSLRRNIAICHAYRVGNEVDWWGRTIMFDALIGNTDRHTENWGLLSRTTKGVPQSTFSFSPVFDNGTSLGFQQSEGKLRNACSPNKLEAFIARGCHHLSWDTRDDGPTPHMELCSKFRHFFPGSRDRLADIISFDLDKVSDILDACVASDVGLPFTRARAEFVLALISARKEKLVQVLEG